MKKDYKISDISQITRYNGFTEMLLQEDYKKFKEGQYSSAVYVAEQKQFYVYGELTFEKVNVDENPFND